MRILAVGALVVAMTGEAASRVLGASNRRAVRRAELDRRLVSVAELDAARKQLDRADEVTHARQLRSLVADLERLGDRPSRGEDDAA